MIKCQQSVYPFSFKFFIIRPSKQTLKEREESIMNPELIEALATLGKIVIDILAGAAKNALSESDD